MKRRTFYDEWKVFRQHKIKYFLVRSTLLFGVPVWIITVLLSWAFDLNLYGENAHLYLLLCCLGGFGYTAFEWKYNEKRFRQMEEESEGGNR